MMTKGQRGRLRQLSRAVRRVPCPDCPAAARVIGGPPEDPAGFRVIITHAPTCPTGRLARSRRACERALVDALSAYVAVACYGAESELAHDWTAAP